jgi:transcriptional regulator with XRE-family HTH domain
MIVGYRLRELREAKKLSQGEIESRTGLLRCYISRVENGHTVPSMETLEKLARGLEVPMYQLFYDGDEPPKISFTFRSNVGDERDDWASRGKGLRLFTGIRKAASRMTDKERSLLLHMARKLNTRRRAKI